MRITFSGNNQEYRVVRKIYFITRVWYNKQNERDLINDGFLRHFPDFFSVQTFFNFP